MINLDAAVEHGDRHARAGQAQLSRAAAAPIRGPLCPAAAARARPATPLPTPAYGPGARRPAGRERQRSLRSVPPPGEPFPEGPRRALPVGCTTATPPMLGSDRT